jgi:hypothetical protein
MACGAVLHVGGLATMVVRWGRARLVLGGVMAMGVGTLIMVAGFLSQL